MWVVEAIGKRVEGALENVISSTSIPTLPRAPARLGEVRIRIPGLWNSRHLQPLGGKRNLSSYFMGIFTCL